MLPLESTKEEEMKEGGDEEEATQEVQTATSTNIGMKETFIGNKNVEVDGPPIPIPVRTSSAGLTSKRRGERVGSMSKSMSMVMS